MSTNQNRRQRNKMDMTVSEQLEHIGNEFCDHYCKWPMLWDEEKEGCELSESEHCNNCILLQL